MRTSVFSRCCIRRQKSGSSLAAESTPDPPAASKFADANLRLNSVGLVDEPDVLAGNWRGHRRRCGVSNRSSPNRQNTFPLTRMLPLERYLRRTREILVRRIVLVVEFGELFAFQLFNRVGCSFDRPAIGRAAIHHVIECERREVIGIRILHRERWREVVRAGGRVPRA